jgi:tellurite resistance protein
MLKILTLSSEPREAGMPLRTIPVSYFRVVSGLAGLGNAWQAAHRVWALPAIWGESLMLAAAIVWAALVMGYGFK